jgi:hypothetical protein
MTEVTADLCERRVREEMLAATKASCAEAALVHQQLAQEYANKALALRSRAKRSGRKPNRSTLTLRHHQ